MELEKGPGPLVEFRFLIGNWEKSNPPPATTTITATTISTTTRTNNPDLTHSPPPVPQAKASGNLRSKVNQDEDDEVKTVPCNPSAGKGGFRGVIPIFEPTAHYWLFSSEPFESLGWLCFTSGDPYIHPNSAPLPCDQHQRRLRASQGVTCFFLGPVGGFFLRASQSAAEVLARNLCWCLAVMMVGDCKSFASVPLISNMPLCLNACFFMMFFFVLLVVFPVPLPCSLTPSTVPVSLGTPFDDFSPRHAFRRPAALAIGI